MGDFTKVMLASTCKDVTSLKYPVQCTPKLDGQRCLTVAPREPGKRCCALSRSFKKIRNDYARNWIEANAIPGLDGELLARDANGKILPFSECSGALSRAEGEPNFVFVIFDYVKSSFDRRYIDRMHDLADYAGTWSYSIAEHLRELQPEIAYYPEVLTLLEDRWVNEGYEGLMVRDPKGPYKLGRSSVKEGFLLKVKRFEDSEGEIVGFKEAKSNQNEATEDAFGRSKRSSHKANFVYKGVVGALNLRDLKTGVEFDIAWNHLKLGEPPAMTDSASVLGKLVKYKFQPAGVKEKPRFPTVLGWRDPEDM